jgi:hypothetical protein
VYCCFDGRDGAQRTKARHLARGCFVTHAEKVAELDGQPGEKMMDYLGRPHGQADRYHEVIAAHHQPRDVFVFHVMELTDVFRHLLSEGKTK